MRSVVAWAGVFVCLGAALTATAAACSGDSSAEPGPGDAQADVIMDGTTPADAPANEASLDAGDAADSGPHYAVCPDGGMDATFGSIYSRMMATTSCGAQNNVCHSTKGAFNTGSGLDYSLDAAAVYAELLGDGGGEPARDPCGNPGGVLRRVVPYEAGASDLYIKLTLTSFSQRYGSGMPLYTPGSICPPALEAVKAWIDDGAQQN